MSDRVLMVEDDPSFAEALQAWLESRGFVVDHHPSGVGVVERVLADPPDALLLDLEVPGETGLSICSRVRKAYAGPILMVTGRDERFDEVIGFQLGADDYLTKPVDPELLVLRLRAALRRCPRPGAEPAEAWEIRDRDLAIDRRSRTVDVLGQRVDLTTGEFELLWLLAQHVGEPVSRDLYYREIRGIRYDGLDRMMDARMSDLR
ncbi:MAG: response regulator transcription factor, partial [Alphaproteobacteria bacterium]|nr:response regulator transcription factor [Alphaproteobacteria bacterium]